MLILTLFLSRIDMSESDPMDTSLESKLILNKAKIRFDNETQIPWFFKKFPSACKTIIEDFDISENARQIGQANKIVLQSRDIADINLHEHPTVNDQPVICFILWNMHYFRHRNYNFSDSASITKTNVPYQ